MKRELTKWALTAGSLLGLAQASFAAQPIVGTWYANNGASHFVMTFLDDGRYVEAAVVDGDTAHTGLEWGTYSWNSVSGEITASSTGDLNGDWGIANDVNGHQFLTVAGNVGNLFQPGCVDCSATLARVTSGSAALVGSWLGSRPTTLRVETFLDNGFYMDAAVVVGDPTHTGIEWGTYSWNSVSGRIDASATGDLNGNWGYANDVSGAQYVRVLTANTAFQTQPCADCNINFSRINPLPVPEPQEYALMLAGLGLLGAAGRRRR